MNLWHKNNLRKCLVSYECMTSKNVWCDINVWCHMKRWWRHMNVWCHMKRWWCHINVWHQRVVTSQVFFNVLTVTVDRSQTQTQKGFFKKCVLGFAVSIFDWRWLITPMLHLLILTLSYSSKTNFNKIFSNKMFSNKIPSSPLGWVSEESVLRMTTYLLL